MWPSIKRWFGSNVDSNAGVTSNTTIPVERLFSVFDADDATSDDLFRQVESDLKEWGYDGFQSRQAAKRIVENALATASADAGETMKGTNASTAVQINDDKMLDCLAAERGDGVTPGDIRWYSSLNPVARIAMERFDEELRSRMWMERHAYHLCMEDLEQDVKRQLPVFGDPVIDDIDSPLPPELKRRFASFMARTKQDQPSFENWSSRLQRASSMNAVIRELIQSGDF